MGYHAYANCQLEFAANVSIENFVTDVIPKIDSLGIWCRLGHHKFKDKDGYDRTAVHIWLEYEGNYHEDDVEKALDLLTPYVEPGSEVFFDGDDAKWEFELVDGNWVELNCYDYYETGLDQSAQYKISRQGFYIGLTDEELKDIYMRIGIGEIRINDEEE